MGFDFTSSRGLEGGHPETEGLSSSGEVTEVGSHAHEVSLNLMRYEVSVSRVFSEHWDAVLRVPYLVKEQAASVVFPQSISSEDAAAAQRSGQIHHRTETYSGFSDLELAMGWRRAGLLAEEDVLRLSAGLTLPVGATEPDPYVLGDAGLEHLHIQFGNGTVDPLLDLYYGLPISEHWATSIFAKMRVPLYANEHGYRGALEWLITPRVTWMPVKRLSISAGLLFQHQGRAHWDESGEDPNSGQRVIYASASAGWKIKDNIIGSINVLAPLYSRSFSDEDQLEPAPVLSASISWAF